MPVTGRIKFFERSKSLRTDGATAMGTSGGRSVENILSFNRDFTFKAMTRSTEPQQQLLSNCLRQSRSTDS